MAPMKELLLQAMCRVHVDIDRLCIMADPTRLGDEC